MKLKQRALILSTVGSGMCFLLIHTWYYNQRQSRHELTTVSYRQEVVPSLHEGSSWFRLRSHLRTMRKNLDFSSYNSSDVSVNPVQNLTIFEHYENEILQLSNFIKNKHKQLVDNTNYRITESGQTPINTNKLPPAALLGSIQYRNLAPVYQSISDNLKSDFNVSLPETIYKALYSASKGVRRIYGSKEKPLLMTLNVHDAGNGSLLAWQQWHNHIRADRLYTPGDPAVTKLLEDLTNQPVEGLYQHEGGTQIKIVFYLADGQRVLFKPIRFPRSQETLPDHFYWSDFERHNAEIAAFHLDKVLGFGRVPPTAARYVNVTNDIKRFADKDLRRTFFVSPAGNQCFHGICDYYCDTGHAVCGRPELIEGSIQAYMPTTTHFPRQTTVHPWRRSYHKREKADWEEDRTYCLKVRRSEPYNHGRRLLDLMDLAAFDFLTGNMDRHHYEIFESFGNFSSLLHYDNGRGFGKSQYDELSILAPVYQCCLFRSSTLKKLLRFYRGPVHLSDAMRRSLEADPLTPILLEPHLTALDRRVIILLRTVYKCVQNNGVQNVIIDDGF